MSFGASFSAGPQGPAGPAGLTGPTGPSGLIGPTGPSAVGGSSFISVNAWLSPINQTLTLSDFGNTLVCLPNQSLTLRLPNPSTLPVGSAISIVNVSSTQSVSIMYNAANNGQLLQSNRTAFIIANGSFYVYSFSGAGIGGTWSWT